MIDLRVTATWALSAEVEHLLRAAPSLTGLACYRSASLDPPGDIYVAQVERDAVNDVIHGLMGLGVQLEGSIEIFQGSTWISYRALIAEQESPAPNNVIWAEVIEQAEEQSRITPVFLTFMVLATMLAAIAVITDSVILVIGAMVVGPEFIAVITMGLALVQRRPHLLRQAIRTLIVGFTVAIAITAFAVWLGRIAGLITTSDVLDPKSAVDFIYTPTVWSFIVALIAAAAGVLAITSTMSTGIIGVFISVTTIPAAGNIAVSTVFGQWDQVQGSALQLGINLGGMALAGWATLAIRRAMSNRVSRKLENRSGQTQSDERPARPDQP
jgi:uncharacterized hydrophobic protein (TIGR00271 family)